MTYNEIFDVSNIREEVLKINSLLRPFATRIPQLDELERVARGEKMPNPLITLGLKERSDDLVRQIISAYAYGPETARNDIRELLISARHFAWASSVESAPTTNTGFRENLLWISASDKTRDPRDIDRLLDRLCFKARISGVRVGPILLEVAEISDRESGYIRKLLLKRAKPDYFGFFKWLLGIGQHHETKGSAE